MFEIAALSVTVVISTSVMFTSYLATQMVGQSAWIAAMAAGLLAAIPTATAAALMARFPQKTFIQALPELLGKISGKVMSVLYACFFLFLASLAVWRMEAFAVRFLIPETPQFVIRLLFLLFVTYAAMSGATPLLRTNAYIVSLQVIIPLLALVLTASRLDFSFLVPLFEQGVKPVAGCTILLLGWFCQAPLVILMFQRLVEDRWLGKGWLKAALGALVATATAVLGFIGIIAALGPQQAATTYYPAYALVRTITVSSFLEHSEVIFVVVWVASIFVAATFYIQAFAESISDIFNLKGDKAKAWTMFATVLVMAIGPCFLGSSFYMLVSVIRDIGSPAGIAFGGIIPILLFIRVLIAPPKQKPETGQRPGAGGTEGGVFGSEVEDDGSQ